jgi:hypothetical protein
MDNRATAAVIIAGVQIGYLFGIAVRYLKVLTHARRIHSISLTSSRPSSASQGADR